MARQRFIWPHLWTDDQFGQLSPLEQVVFIGLFSNADDAGRIISEPNYVTATLFPRGNVSKSRVARALTGISNTMPNVHRYDVNGVRYVQFLKWHDYQKPKYPSPSKLPSPYDDSGNLSPSLSRNGSRSPSRNDSRTGLGSGVEWSRDLGSEEPEHNLERQAASIDQEEDW